MSTASFPGGLAFAGPNSYSYSYSYSYVGANSYSYSAPPEAGIGGFAADPMLSAAVVATRDALLADIALPGLQQGADGRAPFVEAADDGLPSMQCARDVAVYGAQVRASLALFELSSSVTFGVKEGTAVLEASGKSLVTMKRPNRQYFEGQLKQVTSWASRRDVRAAEVLTQVAPPLGYFASLLDLQAGRHRRTLELVNAALQFTYACCMQFKHALACPRPSDYSVAVQPMIEVPMHPSMPAGHAAEGHMTAAVLGALAGAAQGSTTDAMLRQLAHRIAENRVIAGLHFPADLTAGRLLGDALATYFLASCGVSAEWTGGAFEIEHPSATDGEVDEFVACDAQGKRTRFLGAGCQALGKGDGRKSSLLAEMWDEAAAEWRRRKA